MFKNKGKNEKKYKSVFNTHIRIRQDQLDWLKKNKDTKTTTGFLDKIINKFKEDERNTL